MTTTVFYKTPRFQTFAILTLITLLSILIVWMLDWQQIIVAPSYTTTILVVLYCVTVASAILVAYLGKGNPELFTQLVLVSTVLKLIVYAAMMFLVGYQKPGDLMANVILFFSVYLVLTVAEVILLLRTAKA